MECELVKIIETESGIVVAMGWGMEDWGSIGQVKQVSVMQDDGVLEICAAQCP